MDIINRLLKSRFRAELHALLAFVVVAGLGALVLLVVAAVLWAASLTPFGGWAALAVLTISVAVAAGIWWRTRHRPTSQKVLSPVAKRLGPDGNVLDPVRPSIRPRVLDQAATDSPEAMKRRFDQLVGEGRLREAEQMLDRLEPVDAAWVSRKRRLLSRMQARQ